MARGDLSDQEWERLAPWLPPERERRGRPSLPYRQIVNSILWRARTGAPWRDLPERYGSWKTVYSRFRRWTLQGLWTRVLQQLQGRREPGPAVERVAVSIDSTSVRAHQHSAVARRNPGPEKGGAGACPRGRRRLGPQSRRVHHQAAPGQ